MDLKDQRDRFLAFSFAAADLSIELGANKEIVYALGAASKIFDSSAAGLENRPFTELFAPSEASIVDQVLDSLPAGERFGPLVLHLSGPSGNSGGDDGSDEAGPSVVLSGYRMPDREDRIYISLSAINSAAVAVGTQARRDVETQLLAEDSFAQVVKETLKLSQQTGQDLALTLINIPSGDDIKASWGEERMASFLAHAGTLLRAYSVNDSSFRFSPNAFAVLHGRDVDGAKIGAQIAEAAKRSSPDQNTLDISSNCIPIEHGLSEGDKLRAILYTVTDFLDDPERAMAVGSMGEAIDRMLRETGEKIQKFRAAIESESIELYVQPIMCFGSLQVDHYEALVRFGNDRSPSDLISFAEGVGIVHDLDFAVCENAITYILDHPNEDVRLSVNLSGQSLLSSIFNTRLVALLNRNSFDRSRLIFEITDSTNLADLDRSNEALQVLRKMGHPVTLDDFNVDYDALKYLYKLEIDYLKLAGHTVPHMLDRPREALMLKAVAGLCHDMDVKTIATMVEARGQIDFLTKLGVELGQGFFFGKPMPLPTIALNVSQGIGNSRTFGRR